MKTSGCCPRRRPAADTHSDQARVYFLLWYSYTLADAFRMEILWFAQIVKRFVG
jgi:hypothetical protein